MNPSITPAQLELLLKLAGQRLNVDPKTLRAHLEAGDYSVLGSPQQTQQLQQALQNLRTNPQLLEQLLRRLK